MGALITSDRRAADSARGLIARLLCTVCCHSAVRVD